MQPLDIVAIRAKMKLPLRRFRTPKSFFSLTYRGEVDEMSVLLLIALAFIVLLALVKLIKWMWNA